MRLGRVGKLSAAHRGAAQVDETEELIQVCVRALASQMIAAPGAELQMTRNCILALVAASVFVTLATWMFTTEVWGPKAISVVTGAAG